VVMDVEVGRGMGEEWEGKAGGCEYGHVLRKMKRGTVR
jgi:hypothetical protein